jgi:O-antigen ligase
LQKDISVVKSIALVAGVVGLGYLLGTQLMASPETNKSIVALVTCLTFLSLAIANPLYGLVIAYVALPLSYHIGVIDLGSGIPNVTPDRLVIAFVAALFFLQTTTGKRRLRTANLGVNLAALFFLVVYYQTFHNYEWTIYRALQFLLDRWVFPFVIYFLLSNLVVNEQNIDIVFNLLLILAVYSAIYMIYENLTGNVLFQWTADYGAVVYTDTTLHITRGLYGTTTTFGNLYNLIIPLDLYYLLKTRSPGKKVWYLLAFGLMLVGVFLTYKRSVWLGFLLSFLVIQFFYPQFRKLFLIILFVAALGLATSWNQVMSSEAVTARVTETDGDWEDANNRTQRWEAGMESWRRNPIFGGGFRCYGQGPYRQTESLYVHLLASGGLVLFVPFIAMLLITLGHSIRIFLQARDNQRIFVDRNLIPIFWGGFSAYFFMAQFGSGVEGHLISNCTLFAIMGTIVGSQVPLLVKSKKVPAPKIPELTI